ncbi:MAG: cytochrome c oxidase subunit II [Phycisphaeraceae bacterium]
MSESRSALTALAIVAAMVGGCEGERLQSMLHPSGPSAERIAELWWVMFSVYSGVFVLTMLALALALRAGRREEPRLGNRFIAVSGIVIPLVILVVMLVYTIRVTAALEPRQTDMIVEVTGHQFWWEVRYPEHGIVTANELHIPVGASVQLNLKAADVIHSFWVPELAQKMDGTTRVHS